MEPFSTTLIAAISAMGSIVGKKAVDGGVPGIRGAESLVEITIP